MQAAAVLPTPHLVLGGARSGKSDYAERLVEGFAPPYVYVATAQALDSEMEERIEKHRRRRGSEWETVESPLLLMESLDRFLGGGKAVLVDCITLWLSNLLHHGTFASPEQAVEQLCEMLGIIDYPLLLVSNEVGCGLVPDSFLGRRFRDLAGWANQQIALACKGVTWVAAGLPLPLKGGPSTPLRAAMGE
jgi:adenosylcobinamide kinase/adenosylcobinamide-phosphate guanylyltransferase